MVRLDVVRSCNASVVDGQPLVAVFVGGTSGIGEYAVQALAAAHADHGKGLRLYIVGRNETAAEVTISECLKICPKGQFRFVPANDLALLKDVDSVCAEITRAEKKENVAGWTPRIDLLVMTQGYLAFEARRETKEGLDTLLSLIYYSRMRFIMQLLPLLLASPLPGHVVSVFGPQRDDRIFPDDLSLRDPEHYGFMNMGSHVAYMTTFFMENLATKYPKQLSLTHYFPGLVLTNGFKNERLPKWLQWIWRFVVAPIVRPWTVARAESGERVLFLASSRFPARALDIVGDDVKKEGKVDVATSSDGLVGGGAYRANWNGETIPTKKIYEKLREDGLSERIWDHTMKAFEEIEAGKVFTG